LYVIFAILRSKGDTLIGPHLFCYSGFRFEYPDLPISLSVPLTV
jgi:hypothetical protein